MLENQAVCHDQRDRQSGEDQFLLYQPRVEADAMAPATVEAILDGRADAAPTLAEAMKVFPASRRASLEVSTPPRLPAFGQGEFEVSWRRRLQPPIT